MSSNYEDVKSFLTEAAKDIDTHLKTAAYDMMVSHKESAQQTIEKIRRKVRVLESKSIDMIKGLERGKNETERQLRIKVNKEYDLQCENKKLKNEIKRLEAELQIDDSWIKDYSLNESTNEHVGKHQVESEKSLNDNSEEGDTNLEDKDTPFANKSDIMVTEHESAASFLNTSDDIRQN